MPECLSGFIFTKNKMELNIKINIEELLGKTKQLDLTKILALWNELKVGNEVSLLKGMFKIKKIEGKKE